MTDRSDLHEYKFEYQDRHGKVSTNRPNVVQWAVGVKLILQGLATLVVAAGGAYALYAHGGDAVNFISHAFK